MFPGIPGSQISWRHRIFVRLSALRPDRLYPQEMLLVLISVRGLVDSSSRHLEYRKLHGMSSIKTVTSCTTVCHERTLSSAHACAWNTGRWWVSLCLVEDKRQNIVNVSVKLYAIVRVAIIQREWSGWLDYTVGRLRGDIQRCW
jgi:hypothetical protein